MEHEPTVEQLLTADDVAEMTQLRTKYIYELTKRGDLAGIPIGRYWRYRHEDVEAWLHECEQRRDGRTQRTLDESETDVTIRAHHSRIGAMRHGKS